MVTDRQVGLVNRQLKSYIFGWITPFFMTVCIFDVEKFEM